MIFIRDKRRLNSKEIQIEKRCKFIVSIRKSFYFCLILLLFLSYSIIWDPEVFIPDLK